MTVLTFFSHLSSNTCYLLIQKRHFFKGIYFPEIIFFNEYKLMFHLEFTFQFIRRFSIYYKDQTFFLYIEKFPFSFVLFENFSTKLNFKIPKVN